MESAWVCERLNAIGNARTEDFGHIHPINVLSALLTYRNGKSVRGSNTWTPVPQVVDALDKAFDQSFAAAPQTNQRFYLGIDVSGSMGSGEVAGVPGLTPRMAAAAMAMAIARREPNYYIAGFAASDYGSLHHGFRGRRTAMAPLSITATDSLADAMHSNCSELGGSEHLTARGEGVKAPGAPGTEEGSERHLGVGALVRAGAAADLPAGHQVP